jgi:excisionase family DNA binding protein
VCSSEEKERGIALCQEDRRRIDALISVLKEGEGEVVITCTEAARLLGKTKATISAWIKCGKIHKTARGRSIGILLSEVRKIQNP